MANPIVQFGGLEGDQLQTWMTREEKRLKVLRTAYDQQLKKTKERVAKALEPERARSPPAPPPRRAVSMPKATSLSDGGTTNFLEEERLRKTVEIEKFREYEDRVFAKQERVQANRSKALARTRAQAAQAEVALERARQNQSQASDNREEIRRRYSESMQRFEARAAEQERLRHETLTERQVAVLEKRRRARQNCARIRAEKLKAVLDKAGVRDERYHNYKSTLDGKKEEERRSMLEKMAQKRNHVKQEAEAKRKQEEEHQLEKAMQLKEKEARAQQQMQLMRDKQSERFKEWHEWRAFMSDNVQHTSQEQAIHQEYIAARVRWSRLRAFVGFGFGLCTTPPFRCLCRS